MHESIADKVRKKLLAAYKTLRIGNPLDRQTVMGPLIEKNAVDMVQHSIQRLKDEGGEVLYGGERLEGAQYPGGCYMTPCLANAKPDFKIVCHETFGPLLYLLTYRDFDEAIAIHNGVPQGLTSAIFTNDMREAEKFLSAAGSDCGIANVNTGNERRGNWRSVRRRERDRRRPRKRERFVEDLHAPADQHDQFFDRAAAGAGNSIRQRRRGQRDRVRGLYVILRARAASQDPADYLRAGASR